MLSSRQEAEVLKGAIARGWLAESDISQATGSSAAPTAATLRYSPTLDRLLHEGRLPEAGLLELIRETRHFAETYDPRGGEAPPAPPEASNVVTVNTVLAGNKQLANPVGTTGTPITISAVLAEWDHYEITELLGRGGNGLVYRAVDRRLGRTVALKFINEIGAQAGQRVMREARAQARIDHPGVCKVYEVGEYAGQLYIAMEYLPGQSLQDAQHSMTLEEKVYVIKDVAQALHAAHQLGIIHREPKIQKSPSRNGFYDASSEKARNEVNSRT